ncbi:MAG: hypothetical protein CSA62_01055 [Planctomycetota bacterium]|nr:MAG: hypothetical protein CSA62_01055 [Planctomycetota bacterium]
MSVDLGSLRRQEEDTPRAASPGGQRRKLILLVPLLLVLGFAGIFANSLLDVFESATPVTVLRPLPMQGEQVKQGQLLFQAAGWVEPDPFPVEIRALATGVVTALLPREGDEVTAGQLVAKLEPADAQLDMQRAAAEREQAAVEYQLAKSILQITQEEFDAALALRRDVAVAEAAFAESAAAHRASVAKQSALREDLAVAGYNLQTQVYLNSKQANAPWQVDLAKAERGRSKARLAEQVQRCEQLAAARERAKAEFARARGEEELRSKDRLALKRAAAALPLAKAKLARAEALLGVAQLRLQRMQVKSPVSGRVLERFVAPGSHVGPSGGQALLSLYDPASLRVRVDVPQGQVSRASKGQRAEIRSDVRRGKPFAGEVIRIVEKADLQKVTLEVQVRIVDAAGLLKPDMLCQVSVFGSGETSQENAPKEQLYRIPARVLIGADKVFVIDGQSGRAQLCSLSIAYRDGDYLVVKGGIDMSSKVIDQGRNGLEEGQLVSHEGSQ